MNIVDGISIISVPLRLVNCNDVPLGTATGFFWRAANGKTYLVSNYHVFSGNHYVTNLSQGNSASFPAKIIYPRLIPQQSVHERSLHTVTLCDAAGNDQMWRSHPIHKTYPTDLAVVEVPSVTDDGTYVCAVNDEPLRECDKPLTRYAPGFEMIIAGFFLKDRPTGYFPTYIRGSLASEMDALYHGKLAFLIDALTSSGMSGSPVFAVGIEAKDPTQKFSGFKTIPRFVGVYSGRITEQEEEKISERDENGKLKVKFVTRIKELQVGLVWRRELIQETIEVVSTE